MAAATRDYMDERYKIYIETGVRFSPEGEMLPTWIRWIDGRVYTVDRVRRMERAASLKAGGVGLRYTVRIGGRELYLYYEENYKWFIEAESAALIPPADMP